MYNRILKNIDARLRKGVLLTTDMTADLIRLRHNVESARAAMPYSVDFDWNRMVFVIQCKLRPGEALYLPRSEAAQAEAACDSLNTGLTSPDDYFWIPM